MAVAAPLKAWCRKVIEGWNSFWFSPADPATLCFIRVLAGGMLFYTHLVWSLDFEAFFGGNGWFSVDFMRLYREDSYAWSYFGWFDSPALLWTAHIAALVVFALFTLGLYSRVTAVLAFLATLSYVGRVPGALFGLDQINRLLVMYLMLGPCGAAYSLDRLWMKRKSGGRLPPAQPLMSANIAIRLIQVHMCMIYLFAGASKLVGRSWWTGSAMWLAFANYEYQSLDMTWMAHWPILLNFITHITVCWELSYSALIWPRMTRPVMLLLAIPLHLGIGICLGMMTFGLVMLIANLAFIPPGLVRSLLGGQDGEVQKAEIHSTASHSAVASTGPQRKRRH